jgi:poly-gamma-glutamate capsule biosynthesis protein CapA/YwtB (metallophosphatase superfamily)
MKLRHFILIIIFLSILWQFSNIADAPVQLQLFNKKNKDDVVIGWVGDMVPSANDAYNYLAFSNVTEYLNEPDLMIGNLEGTFASVDRTSKCSTLFSQCHAFRGNETFAYALKFSGFDLVSLVNNHSYDYGSEGLQDTEKILKKVGIPYISPTKPTTIVKVNGIKVGVLGVSSTPPQETINNLNFITTEIKKLKNSSDIVIVIFHGGAEGEDKTLVPGTNEFQGTENRGNVELVAKTAIDSGADLVLGSGPHVLRKIETYKGKPIAYSLGNFVGGGKLRVQGLLGTSGIFTTTFSKKIPSSFGFTSILLTETGIPYIDTSNQGKLLIEKL